MSKLYDIVNKTINAKSMVEAEQILFGSDGIVINSNEYYKNIISNFGKKKESIIRKTVASNGKTQLIFDLNDCNDIWNILFIYNYYIRYIDEKLESLNQDIKKYQNVQKKLETEKNKLTLDNVRYQEIIKELETISSNLKELGDLKNKYFSYKNDSLKKHVVQLENIEKIDEDKLKEYLNKLKEAVCCIQKMRDSFEHSNENLKIDKIVSIDNSRDKFEISIPIEYLDGFNKGRIIANEEDKILVEETNHISSPLLEALDYDIKKIDSFFYNVEPSYLEFILEKVNYDVNELYKLSHYVFKYKEGTRIFIENGLNIYNVSKLSNNAFEYLDNAIELVCKGINITKLPDGAFEYSDNVIELINNGINVTNLPDDAFYDAENTIKLIKGLTEKGINVDMLKLSKSAFYSIESTIELINILIEKGINIEISKLPKSAFYSVENTIKLIDNGIDIIKLPKSAFYDAENTIELVKILLLKRIDITKLPDDVFKYSDNVIKLINNGIDITKLPKNAFYSVENTLKLTKILQLKGIDITKLSDDAFYFVENKIEAIESLTQYGIDISKLPQGMFYFSENAIELIEKLNQNEIDITKLPKSVFYFPEIAIELIDNGIDVTKLPKSVFYFLPYTLDKIDLSFPDEIVDYIQTTNFIKEGNNRIFGPCIKNLKKIIHKIGYEQLEILPIEFFNCNIDMLDEMFKKYNLNISKSIFGIKNPKIIASLVYANSILSDYNKDINTLDMDIQPYSIVGDMYVDNFKYRNNIEENIGRKYNSSEFVEQFKLLDENNLDRSMDDIKKVILNKFRNACAHFRFKLVKDKDGNIVEDKIYIYDEDNNGLNNFNLIIDLNEFVRIVREVEIELDKQKNKEEQSVQKSR